MFSLFSVEASVLEVGFKQKPLMVAQLVETILKQNQDRNPKNPTRHSIAKSLDHRSSEECQIWALLRKMPVRRVGNLFQGLFFLVSPSNDNLVLPFWYLLRFTWCCFYMSQCHNQRHYPHLRFPSGRSS